MNSNNTLILGIAGGSIAMVILGLIIYNVTGNTGDDGKGVNITKNNDEVESYIPYGNDVKSSFNNDDFLEGIPRDEVNKLRQMNKDDGMDDEGDMPKVYGGKPKKRSRKRVNKKKRKTQKKKHKK